jgi:hypothetical protein
VSAEVELYVPLFPEAVLVGDDYDWTGVDLAVGGVARRRELTVEMAGARWRGWRLRPRGTDRLQAATIDLLPPACGPPNRDSAP